MPANTDSPEILESPRHYGIGYGSRFLIYMIDGGVLVASFLPAFLISMLFHALSPLLAQAVMAAWFLAAISYLTLLKRSHIGTLGYRALGVKIVDACGHRPSLFKMAVRLVTPILVPEIILIDLHGFGRSDSRQTLADRLAGTYVVVRSIPPEVGGASRFNLECFGGFTVASEE